MNVAAKDQRKLAAAAMAAGVLALSIVASVCRPSKWGRPRVMSAYPDLAGDFAL
jgi:hypothetical protein